MKVVFCTPTITEPYPDYIKSLEKTASKLEEHGWETQSVYEIGNPYISAARAIMLRKALDAKPDAIVFLDHDISWEPEDMGKLLHTDAEVVGGTYRFKKDEEEYMGAIISNGDGIPVTRNDGCIKVDRLPAGFLKVTPKAIDRFMEMYPELVYGPRYAQSVDLFNHGVIDRQWMGEDYAFSKRWCDKCGDLWCVPNLNINHHSIDQVYKGNLHIFLRRQPGGDLHEGDQ